MNYKLVATAIICKGEKYLITKRSMDEKNYPGYWTVPGGTIDPEDHTTPNEDGLMYDVIEHALKREIKEETGLEYENLRYVVSIVYKRHDGYAMCLSYAVDYVSGEVILDDEATDYAWVRYDELDNYELIKGIKEEIEIVEKFKKK